MKLREEEFYYQYHQHGGTTIIPTEIFNVLYDDATEEIERLNKENERIITELNGKESIIKEVREYIDYYGITPEQNDDVMVRHILKGILEILDKVDKDNK